MILGAVSATLFTAVAELRGLGGDRQHAKTKRVPGIRSLRVPVTPSKRYRLPLSPGQVTTISRRHRRLSVDGRRSTLLRLDRRVPDGRHLDHAALGYLDEQRR
jgi:hypothetical protein